MQTFADTYRYRFILANLVGKELKALYRNQSLGFLWTLLNPLVMVTVLSFVWVVFFERPTHFPSLVVTALVPYNFFSYCLSGCSHAVVTNANLVKKVYFPRQILPFSVVATHSIHFAVQCTLVAAILLLFPGPGTSFGLHLLWLPLIVLVNIGLCMGAGLLVSGLNVLYRDVQYLVDSLMTVLFWFSPIVYETSRLADTDPWLRVAYYLNPLAGLFDAYRDVLYFGRSPDCLLYTSPSPRDRTRSRMPSSA